jgi:glycosyltransferase involved in cell wall biosynthesis
MAASSSDGAGDRLRLAFLGDVNSVHLRRWAGFFAERGHRVTLFAGTNQSIEPGLPPSISVERFRPFNARGPFPPGSFLLARRSIRRAMGRSRPDVVNAHFMNPHGWHAWMSGHHPYVVTLWGSDVFIAPRLHWAVARFGRITLRAADMVMVNSEALRRGALELGAPPERTEMVQWGVDLTRFAPGPDPVELRARLGLDGRRVVFSPRAIAPLYRQGVIVRALAQLPADVTVVMSRHRSDAAEVAAVERQAESLGLADRLVLLPYIEDADMPDLVRLADVVVSVPASDSTSATILEALACGRQVVAADLVSVREWLGDLDPQALVPVDDVDATAAAIARALGRDAAQRAELGRRARAIVELSADQAASLGRVETLYLDLARRSRVAR